MPKKVLFSREDYFRMLDNMLDIPGQPKMTPQEPMERLRSSLRTSVRSGLKRIPKFPTIKG